MADEIKQYSELELNIKALLSEGWKVKNNEMQLATQFEGVTLFQVKDIDLKKNEVAFYFSSFNHKDSDGDIVLPGAFTKTIKENRNRIKHLYNHNKTQSPGVIKSLGEDSHGAFAVSELYPAPHQWGVQVGIEYAKGGITEHSMGYKAIKENFDQKANANIISEIYLGEASSLVAWGANERTPMIGMKKDFELDIILKEFHLTDEQIKAIQTLLLPKKKGFDWDAFNKALKS